ncbi:transglutaminase superfamily protein [Chitinophaga dinghuensis]|uniref:Transglutaminase superfamily protein n=1 Tax=Chitinophaga dinghuensis TaxID=1539050 RepID=A0A327VY88_9BACT|nr:lasso peptide biosynthesis B2 protein [Chitinophaga dinghuensis]RAJ80160.1 transglutaminase superfamily protein [Chitinophaga dinghuensis]
MYSEQKLLEINAALKSHNIRFLKARMLTSLLETSLAISSLKSTRKLLSFFKKNIGPATEDEAIIIIDCYTTIFNRMQALPSLKGRCLSRSLALSFMLSRKGISSDLRIGVCHYNGNLDSHAWLERNGRPINDHPSVIARYFVLPEHKISTRFR